MEVAAGVSTPLQLGGVSCGDVGPNREYVSGRLLRAALSARLTPAKTAPIEVVVTSANAIDAARRRRPAPGFGNAGRVRPMPVNRLVASRASTQG